MLAYYCTNCHFECEHLSDQPVDICFKEKQFRIPMLILKKPTDERNGADQHSISTRCTSELSLLDIRLG